MKNPLSARAAILLGLSRPAYGLQIIDRIRDQTGADAATVVQQRWPRMCGVSFAALGAELPAVREQMGIFLFRLRPP